MKNNQISILGCGWLGLPLAEFFISQNKTVKGATTTESKIGLLKEKGIEPFLMNLGDNSSEQNHNDFFEGSDIIILNFPPKRIPNVIEVYQQKVNEIIPYITKEQKVIFVSSTSVYQNTNDWVTEELINQPEKNSGKAVLAVENLLKEHLKDRVTILRLSGLIGYDRVPGRFLANKKSVTNGKAPINVIHQDDCVGLIDAIIEQEQWGEIFNGSSDEHPTREEFYRLAALKENLIPPEFIDSESIEFKKVCNQKSKEKLKYIYKYPDPLLLVK